MRIRLLPLIFVIIITNTMFVVSKTITSSPVGGNWDNPASWVGNIVPTEADDVLINSTIYCPGQSYSTKTYRMNNLNIEPNGKVIRLENSSGLSSLNIAGNLTNYGEIVDYDDYFDIDINGNLKNYGTLSPRYIRLNGDNATILTENYIECSSFNINTKNPAIAISDLKFKNTIVTSSSNPQQMLNLDGYDVFLTGDEPTYDGYYNTFNTNSDFRVRIQTNSSVFNIDKSILYGTIDGNITIKSPTFAIIKHMEIVGDFTVDDNVVVSSGKHLTPINVTGKFYNYGLLSHDTLLVDGNLVAPISFKISVIGDCYNYGSTGISNLYLYTKNENRLFGGDFQSNVYIYNEDYKAPGGSYSIFGNTHIAGKLELYADLQVPINTTLYLDNQSGSSLYISNNGAKFNIDGDFYRVHYVNNSWSYNTFDSPNESFLYYQLRNWDGIYKGTEITTYQQKYPNIEGTISRWWRIEPIGELQNYSYIMTLHYEDKDLDGLNEDDLNVFHSTDQGTSWELISFGEFVEHNKEENYFQIGVSNKVESHLTAFGDFVIGSVEAGVPIESPIYMNYTGRNDVRIAAPTRFTINLFNVSKTETQPFILCFDNTDQIHFTGVELPTNGDLELIPIDSIGNREDALVFLVPYLGPLEEYSFDVIVEGLPNIGSVSNHTLSGVQRLTLAGFGKKLGKEKAEDYIAKELSDFAELSDEEYKEYARAMNLTVSQLKTKKKKEGKGVFVLKTAVKYVAEKISNTNPVSKVLFKIGSAAEFVHKISDSYRRRIFHWINKDLGLYGIDKKTEPITVQTKEKEIVTSRDPNAIVGPNGHGQRNFVKELSVVNYRIQFENVKDAGAAAYRIEILDTLDAEIFDLSTVKFGRKSHEGSQYDWQIDRNGNVLRWYIEGIELEPNITPPQGEGWVDFSVALKESVYSGIEIKNSASIIFDINEPIQTNTWINIIDNVSPVATINPIGYTHGENELKILLAGQDNKSGSGIGKYYLFGSINNAPYQLFGESYKENIDFPIDKERDSIFKFYTIASDNVDNLQTGISNIEEIKISSTSVFEKYNSDIVLSVSPNPVVNNLHIQITNASNQRTFVRISNLLGEVVYSNDHIFDSVSENLDIPFANYPKGVYILDIINGSSNKSTKFVK